jgi:hypothetical protein
LTNRAGTLRVEYALCNQLFTQYDLPLSVGFDRVFDRNGCSDDVTVFIPQKQILMGPIARWKYLDRKCFLRSTNVESLS